MYFYNAYGLGIHSTFALPELVVDDHACADVVVRVQPLDNSPLKTDQTSHCFKLTDEGMYIFWEGVGTFLIQNGEKILIDPVPEADEDRLRLFVLGAAIGVILYQRGYLVLHSSAVEIDGSGVAFIGHKGWGKSTMAATLHARGHGLIGDDVVAIDLNHAHGPLVLPAFPQLKLWPDAASSVGTNPESLPRLVSHLEKRDRRIGEGFVQHRVPLKQIFLLGKGSRVEIKPLEPQSLMTYLLQNSYVTRFGNELLRSNEAAHFQQLLRLARQVNIDRLLRPSDLSLLPTIAQWVENRFVGAGLTV